MRLASTVTVYRVHLHAAVPQLCDAPLTSLRISLGKASVWHGGISDRRSWKHRDSAYTLSQVQHRIWSRRHTKALSQLPATGLLVAGKDRISSEVLGAER